MHAELETLQQNHKDRHHRGTHSPDIMSQPSNLLIQVMTTLQPLRLSHSAVLDQKGGAIIKADTQLGIEV